MKFSKYLLGLLALVASLAFAQSAVAADIVPESGDAWASSASPTFNHNAEEWTHIDADAPTDANGKGVPSAYTWVKFPTTYAPVTLDKTKTYMTFSIDAFTWYGGQKVSVDQVASFNPATVTWNNQPAAVTTGLATVSQPSQSLSSSNREHYTFPTASVLDGSGNLPSTLYFRLRLTKGTAQEVYVGGWFTPSCAAELGTTNNPTTDPAYSKGNCF